MADVLELVGKDVEWKPLKELFEIRNGFTPSKSHPEYWDNGSVPWFRVEDLRQNGRILDDAIQHVNTSALKKGEAFPANSIIVTTSATIGEHALITCDFLANQRFTCLSLKDEYKSRFSMKFLNYYFDLLDEFCFGHLNSGNFASVKMHDFKNFEVPVPPLEVQQEIVRILDLFTGLKAELQKELQARGEQFSFYRDKLLDFGDEVPRKPLGEVAKMIGGKDYKHLDVGNVPVYGSGGLMTYVSEAFRSGPSVLLPRKGSISNIFYVEGPFWHVDTVFSTEIDVSSVMPRFFYYVMLSKHIEDLNTSNAARPALTRTVLNQVSIPVPPLSVQKDIVEKLDAFSELVGSLKDGLPAEIEAREKQYEYYRDKLLSF